MPSPCGAAASCGVGSGVRAAGAIGAFGCGCGAGAGAGTTGVMNSSGAGCCRRLRHHTPASKAASAAIPPTIHGQYDPEAPSAGAGWITLPVGGIAGKLELPGSGTVVTGSATTGAGAVLGLDCGAAVATGRGAARVGALRLVGGGLVVAVGALGTGVGLATGTGLGAGVGRTTGARTTGLSASTGPCERGLLVGRAPGIEKSGRVCAAASAGTSAAASAAAPVAAFAPPPIIRISQSILLRSGALAPLALNRK